MKNYIFIDSEVPLEGLLRFGDEVGIDQTNLVRYIMTDNGPERVSQEVSSGNVGMYAIVTTNPEPYARRFPNNVVKYEGAPSKVLSQVDWIFRNFGREYKANRNVFVTSDTHFWHANIIKYCDRPWKTAEEMNGALVEKWNSVVGKDDVVFHLGDFSFGKRDKVKEVFDRLNGKINLVMGNHDRLRVSDYYEIGFNRVYDRPILYDNFFILSHAPIEWVRKAEPYANVYGHVHNMETYRTCTGNSFCACVERHDYAPVPFSEVKRRISKACSGKDE